MKKTFTDRQMAFMKSYVVHQNATKAAIEAGYSTIGAAQTAAKLLRHTKIREAIDTTLASIAEGQEVRAADVIRETKIIAMSNVANYLSLDPTGDPYVDLNGINHRFGAAIKSIDILDEGEGPQRRRRVKLVLHDKLKALDKLDAATGAFTTHNKGVTDDRNRPIIQVITGISESVGSRVKV